MSLLSDFANGAFTQASTVIGTTTMAIGGGTAVTVVKNDVRHSKSFDDGGFEPDRALNLVCNTSTFAAAYTSAASSYVGNTATVDATTYRVSEITVGISHVTIALSHEQRPL